MFKALILIDNDSVEYSLNLIELIHRLAGDEVAYVYGLGINLSGEVKGLDAMIRVNIPMNQQKDSRIFTDIIEQVHKKYQFDSIIILATDFGRMIAPRLAMRLEVGLVADITDVEVDKRGRKLIRPAFSGNIMAKIVCESSPIMASVHPNVFHADELTSEPEIINFIPTELKASTIEVLDILENEQDTIDIREADVLVSAGGGFTKPIDELKVLAEKLNGIVAVSKRLVDCKKAPREIQVGQSGKTVSPSLYIALGIYGSTQHIEGLKNVKEIISVNTDLGAPMNYLANLVVHGDATIFAEKLRARLQE
ncbi:electron transfer flavoprotein subunit alpha/FixB family protein [Enterococcus xiangfangensis]|uniref:electron transfer flavoprotein subunit alpha/FixB family protein n=1 Tax=Enterococcus xiangfangensis TaxID=1296537 RepID=UPI0010F7E269|nr:electron transfer flavoprotein subunit alpha/FixB family protein [Enterococcus xiangfangensis]MBM7710998.1 electron transfer flavoprotein alpha subunit [Enterococcus xiangfangensis]